MERFTDQVCIVTGAARGIGLAIAERFLAEGGTVLLSDKDEAAGRAAAARIGAAFRRLDVASEADWLALEESDVRPDVVVNNAGVTGFEGGAGPHDPEHARLSDWRAVHAVNLDGTFLGCRYALRAFRAKGAPVTGAIVNVSLRSGMVGVPGAAA